MQNKCKKFAVRTTKIHTPTLETDSSAAGCYYEPSRVVAKSRYEEQCCRRFDKVSESTSFAEHADRTEIEPTEHQHENAPINMFTARRVQKEQMDAQQSRRREPGPESKCWAQELRDGS